MGVCRTQIWQVLDEEAKRWSMKCLREVKRGKERTEIGMRFESEHEGVYEKMMARPATLEGAINW